MQDFKKPGNCHICGVYGSLTYEHVPPEKAFNNRKVFTIAGSELLKVIGLDQFPWDVVKNRSVKKIQKQNGIGFYTLCGKCNNNTGGWYGGGFVDFIEQGYLHINERGGYSKIVNGTTETIQFTNVYPLQFIKEIITMFFSVNSPQFSATHTDLKKFVLDKESKLNSTKYALYIALMKGTIVRYVGTAGILHVKPQSSIIRIVSEISTSPFGFVLEIDPKPDKILGGSNIIGLAKDYGYNDKTDIHLKIPVLESNTEYPLDYRTRQEVFLTYIQNKFAEIQKKP